MEAGFGAFGKMPAVGDFFRLSPPKGFVAVWDDWVQQTLLAAQSAFGPDWDALYMSAPIWRFSLSPGLAGPRKAQGVLMPSVDRVGRRFPLTLVAGLPGPGPAALDHFADTGLFARLEDVALAALDDGMTRDRLAEDLAQVAVPAPRDCAPLRAASRGLVMTQPGPEGLLPDLAADLLATRTDRPSIWSAVIQGVPRLMICEGLPQGDEALGLFSLTAPIWSEARPI